LTGTPIQNKIEDVWALFKFLRLSPINEREMFNQYISSPCKAGDQMGVARLQLVMKCCTLRRTKDSTAEDGRRILNLPPRKEMQVWLDLREDEREVYLKRKGQVLKEIDEMKQNEEETPRLAAMLQYILRLRQTCNHVDLVNTGAVEEDYDGTIMDYQVAVQGINMHGLNQARAVSVVCFMKEGDQAQCSGCGADYGDYFPSMGLAGVEDYKPKKKLPTPLILTKCLHLYCECFISG
jgi:SWI/SNF-related matrix-associated actin-dependent regulator of chromatin subfamily A3